MASTAGQSTTIAPHGVSAEQERYSRTARLLHWTIAALVIFNLVTGIGKGSLFSARQVMPLHMSVGVLILLFTLMRIGWRLTHRPPAEPPMARWEFVSARITHHLFYVLLLLMPITGYIFTSAGRGPVFFGLTLPHPALAKTDPLVGAMQQTHVLSGWFFGALVLLHIGGALRHHFILKDQVLRRMTG